jgi:hypothetical protein
MKDASGVMQPQPDPAGRTEAGLPFRVENLGTEELSAPARLAELAGQADPQARL